MPAWSQDSRCKPKEGDTYTDEHGVFRVVKPDYKGCNYCDHFPYACTKTGCGEGGFRLLTEINYVTHKLTR